MKKTWLFAAVLAALAFAYSAFETEAQPTAPTLPQTVSRPIVENGDTRPQTPAVVPAAAPIAAPTKATIARADSFAEPKAVKKASVGRRIAMARPAGAHKKLEVSVEPKSKAKPSLANQAPKAKPLPILPRPGSDVGMGEYNPHVNYELGENRHDVEERNTMRIRTHQELKQYRLVAVNFNF